MKSLFGPYVAESIATYGSDDEAHGYVTSLKSVLNACQSFDEKDKDGKVTHTTLAPLSFDKFEDETVAARLTVTSEMGPAVFDTVVVRAGRTILFLANGGFGGVIEDTEKLVRKAVDKANRL